MSLWHHLWVDTLDFLHDPLLTIGKTDLTLLRLLGLVAMLLAVRKLAVVVRRSISRLTVDPKSDPGIYLLQRLSGYLVWFAGTFIALEYLGFELSSFAFLGGAIGVGLGFGLQNVLHNFVSGVIILFEKTVKVGDVVELQSGVTGEVVEIKLRYTHIATPDLMDILVPNSEFISARVVNWSFGEEVRRVHVPFSVAYGTDKEQVREAAVAAALRSPRTLTDPARQPDVWLVKMGDNGLEFELVVWVGNESLGHPSSTQAHYLWELETELRNRQIAIPFPQRDLHLKNARLTVALETEPPQR